MPKIQNQIKFYKYITDAGVSALVLLTLLTLNLLIPINFKGETAIATGDSASTTSLTLDVASSTAGVELLVTSESGTFASTASGDEMSFNVTTNNVTGYMLSISAKFGTDLTNSAAGTSFASLDATNSTAAAGITADTFGNADNTVYNNMWGFKPNYYKSTANTDKFYPSPTTSGVTLNKTDSANTDVDTYTIAIGARATYAQVAGTYSNTYILSAVGNYPEYKITYNDASGESSDLPSAQEADSEANDKTTVNFSDKIPTRDGYEFVGWCSVDNSADPTSCNGTTYAAGDEYALSTLSSNIVPLYAIWAKKIYMQNLSTSECVTTSATKVYDNRDETAYYIQRLADGKCWLLDNLALDLTDANVQSKLNSSTTNATNTGINYLLNGGGTSSDKYAMSGISDDWGGSYSYSAPLITTSGTSDNGIEWNVNTLAPWPANIESIDGKTGGRMGAFYNYCAASAGTYCYGNGTDSGVRSGNATADICPAGWRLPTGSASGEYITLYYAYDSNYADFTLALRLPLAGRIQSGGILSFLALRGIFWSSTNYNDDDAFVLSIYGGQLVSPSATGRYIGQSVRCVMKENIAEAKYMQEVNQNMIANMAELEEATLTDSRDDQDYTVKKINGQLWMTRNLAIGCNGSGSSYGSSVKSVQLTSGDSNVAEAWATPTALLSTAANSSAASGYDTAAMQCSSTYGAWYNYAAASAGTITGASNSDSAVYSICPLNWHLPTGPNTTSGTDFNKLVGNTTSGWQDATSGITAFNAVDGGFYVDGVIKNTGIGHWWSSTNLYGIYRHYLAYNSGNSQLFGDDNSYRYIGHYIRCVHD